MATLASLGRLAGQFVEHRRAEAAVRESEARKRAMLDAALDAVITIDAGGRIVEVNAAVAGRLRPSARGARRARDGRPRSCRPRCASAHRDGLARGTGKLIGRRVEITALHADGRELPVELTITRIDVPGPADVHRLRARHHRPPRSASASCASRARGSSPPPTRRAAGSSATSTTARRAACSRSGWT